MKKIIKKDRVIILLGIVALIVTAILWVFHLKPDWKYIIMQTISFSSNNEFEGEIVKVDTQSISIKEVKKQKNVVYEENLMLINKDNTLSKDYMADLSDYNGKGLMVNRCMISAFKKLSDDVKEKFGQNLLVMSGYRTAEEQQELFEEKGKSVAEPVGSSEHQTGLALDVYVQNFSGSAFIKSEVGQFVNSECWKYGFVIRYPLKKNKITGIDYEPWHIRYVGLPHSEIIQNTGIVLEEYSNYFETGKYYSYGSYLISHQKGNEIEIPKEFQSLVVSPDNYGGFYITAKKFSKRVDK